MNLSQKTRFSGGGNRCFKIPDKEVARSYEFLHLVGDVQGFAMHVHDVAHKSHSYSGANSIEVALLG